MSIIIKKGPVPDDIHIPSLGKMSDEEFFRFAASVPDIQIERDKEGNIFIMPPLFGDSANYESEALIELGIWNRSSRLGRIFSPSAGFILPNGAMRSPDAAWISNQRLAELPDGEFQRFMRVCPDFVIEIRSASDRLKTVQGKMEEYIENGARLGFLIDPKEQQAFIYRADGSVETVQGFDGALSGEPVLPGFSLPLSLFKPQP
jgi:Uma2 family endonuclease